MRKAHTWSDRPYTLLALLAAACTGVVGERAAPPTRDVTGPADPAPAAPATPGATPAMPAPASPAAGPSAGATPPPAPAPPPAAAPPVTGRGPFDCPTVTAPPYGAAAADPLSAPFHASCANCHGGAGEGKGAYPRIPGTLTEAAFIDKVRHGGENMPRFPPEFVSDAQLRGDYAALGKLNGAGGGGARGGGEWTWTDAQVDDAYRRGLTVWRKQGDVDGLACSNCHAPDGVDLAMIGFPDDAILRRAQKHLGPDDALAVRDFVHAQRRRFGVRQTCSPDWRPFQPTGQVLPGATPAERDIAFLEALKQRNLMVVTGKVVTLDDAKRAWAELQQLDLRQVPIPTALPRWTEDRFNGEEHRTQNDWMPPLPTIPKNAADFYAKEDAYLANPTDQGLLQLIAMQKQETTDGGYSAAKNAKVALDGCGRDAGRETGVIDVLTQRKRSSVLVAQHLFRMALLRRPSALETQMRPPGALQFPNPMWSIGQRNSEPTVCAMQFDGAPPLPNLMATLTPDMLAELSARDRAGNVLKDLSIELADPWMTLGMLFDQAFVYTIAASNPFNYWAALTFPHKVFFLPFTYTHRRALQSRYWEMYGKASGLPTHPLLDGSRVVQFQRKIETAAPNNELNYPGYDRTGADANRMKGNLIRMTLLLQRELLQKGTPVFQPQDLKLDHFSSFARQMPAVLKDTAQAPLRADAALYSTDIEALTNEVASLVAKAPLATGQAPQTGNPDPY